MAKKDRWAEKLAFMAALGAGVYYGGAYLGRALTKKITNKFIYRIMVDPYHENIWEPISATRKVGLQNLVETELRSEEGKVIKRPLGSPKKFPDLENVMFDFAQLHRLPVDETQEVDTTVVIGPCARKPLKVTMPIIISGMAYGLALSAKAKIALAKGTTMAGTAANSGEGPFLPAERKAAEKIIIQYSRGAWNKSEKVFKQGDAIEIQIGQGAEGGLGTIVPPKELGRKLSHVMGLRWGHPAYLHSNILGMKNHSHLNRLVSYLKELTEGVPVGVKIAGSKYLEKDLEIALEAGVDYIVIDGAQAGSKGTAPILQDDFGLPTLFALVRAANYFEKHNCRDKVSLISSGGFYTPGQMLKALALGADAVYIGAIALFAVSHTEVLKAIPWEPPTAVAFYDGAFKNKFNTQKGAKNIANFLISCNEEIKEGVRALGKTRLKEVNKEDLFALDSFTAEVLDIPIGYKEIPFEK